jgi:solute:Na+ symporter, SSS family
MHLYLADWIIVVLYFVLATIIAIALSRRARRSIDDYFATGRSLPWWLAGTSMVATTFAADTPLAVTGLVAKHGIAGNWLWWNMALSGMLTVFFFSRLWRRAGVLTDVEFSELRYSGIGATILRATRSVYLAIPINLIIMAWVSRAMITIMETTLGIDGTSATLILFAITAAYVLLSGLWGVVLTDFLQFIVAMVGSIALAVVAVNAVGGLDALATLSQKHFGQAQHGAGFFPPLDGSWLPLTTLLVFLAVQWWAAWYPGAEPGGGGYIAQRMLSTKNERHSLLAVLWFNIAHYAIRPWPWILVALVASIRYPNLDNPEQGYVLVMVDLLPTPLKGLLLAAFVAAYMSTISTHLNWGASYLVNDIYLRFLRKQAALKEQILVGRLATGVLIILAMITMQFLTTVESGWKLLMALGAGTGSVLILRWYWWRINAWSEISAMVASFATAITVQYYFGYNADDPSGAGYAIVMLWTAGITTLTWIVVTLLTPAESSNTLEHFYHKVRPGGLGWRRVARRLGYDKDRIPGGALSWLNWLSACVAVYTTLFGCGELLLGSTTKGLVWLGTAAISFAVIAYNLRQDSEFMTSTTITKQE